MHPDRQAVPSFEDSAPGAKPPASAAGKLATLRIGIKTLRAIAKQATSAHKWNLNRAEVTELEPQSLHRAVRLLIAYATEQKSLLLHSGYLTDVKTLALPARDTE